MTTLANVTTAATTLETNIQGLLNTYIDGATVNKGNAQVMIALLNDYNAKVAALNANMLAVAAPLGAV